MLGVNGLWAQMEQTTDEICGWNKVVALDEEDEMMKFCGWNLRNTQDEIGENDEVLWMKLKNGADEVSEMMKFCGWTLVDVPRMKCWSFSRYLKPDEIKSYAKPRSRLGTTLGPCFRPGLQAGWDTVNISAFLYLTNISKYQYLSLPN